MKVFKKTDESHLVYQKQYSEQISGWFLNEHGSDGRRWKKFFMYRLKKREPSTLKTNTLSESPRRD